MFAVFCALGSQLVFQDPLTHVQWPKAKAIELLAWLAFSWEDETVVWREKRIGEKVVVVEKKRIDEKAMVEEKKNWKL